MGQNAFIKNLQSFQRRLNIASMIQKVTASLCIGAGVGIFFQAVAFVVPFYDASLYSVLALVIAFLTAVVIAFVKRATLEQTALVMDSFGFDERFVTAYECLGQEGTLIELQRDDALNQLELYQDRIQIPLMSSWKRAILLLVLLSVMSGLTLFPSAVKERAGELHEVREEAREKIKEIEELVDSLEELAQKELSQEQKDALQEMIESLESSQTEYEKADSSEMLTAVSNKLEYKYETMGSELAQFAKRLQDGASTSTMTAESMQAMAEKMQKTRGVELASGDGAQPDSSQNGQSGDGGQDGQSGDGSQDGQSGDGSQDGQSGDGGQDGQSGDGGTNGQGGNQGESANTAQNGHNGDGRGTGSSSTPHDYVSIPNEIADSGNLIGNAVNHEGSAYLRAQNGLSWEGMHMSHEAVLGSYEQKAYEGIAAGRYPSGMEDVIKQYFSSFNQ